MLKRFLQKILDSGQHSKHMHRKYSSSGQKHNYNRRSSSDHGYGHKNQGHSYYKNKYRSSS